MENIETCNIKKEGIWFNIKRDEVPFWQIFLLVKIRVKLICNYWTIFIEDKAPSQKNSSLHSDSFSAVITNMKSISADLQDNTI